MVSATLIAEGRAIAGRITSQEWVQGGSGSFPAPSGSGAGVDGMLAALTANNLGWVVGQLGPLKSWMDGLDSDAGAVTGLTQSWQSAATQMQSVGDGYERRLRDLDGMSGKTIDAYAAHGAEIAEHFRVQGELVGAVAVGVRLASQLVRNVHGTVQDGVAEVAATALAAKTRSVLTGGSMSPAMVAQVTAKSASVTARVGPVVAGVVATLGILGPLLRLLFELLKALGKWLAKLFSKAPKKPAVKPKPSVPIAKPPKVKDSNLQNRLNEAYMRDGFTPKKGGDGSLVDAIRKELLTGEKIGGKNHIEKGEVVRNSLKNWIRKNPDADPSDIETAKRVMKEIEDALNGN